MPRPGHSRLGALGGPTPVDFFSPRTTQCTHSASRPGHSPPRITWGPDNCLLLLHAHITNKLSGIQHPDPYKFWLGVLGAQTGLRPSYFLVLPASTAPCPEHFQAKALKGRTGINRAARTHLLFSRQTTHKLFLPSHMLFHPTQMFFLNYPIDWIRAMIYGA